MGLTCSCADDLEPGTTYAWTPEDYSILGTTRRRRCMSCGALIDIGSIVARSRRIKIPESDIEVAIYGEDGEIPRAPGYLCEVCADLCFSLGDLGFCINPNENMHDLLADYVDMQNAKRARDRIATSHPRSHP